MSINVYDVGQLVPVTGLFEDAAGVDIDPSSITLRVISPSGINTVYIYGGSPDTIDKDSVGNYHVDVNANEAGDWFYKWEGTGSGQAAQEGQFMVQKSHF
jgi:hypothetical protein